MEVWQLLPNKRSTSGILMTHLTADIDKKIIKRASESAEKRMPEKWDRKSLTMVNVFNSYLMEALQAEYNQLISSANAHGYIEGLTKKLTVSQSLKAFYEDI
jgi:hypothetical protein